MPAARAGRTLLLLAVVLGGCEQHKGGFTAVGGDEASTAEIERFARRLHLDLTGSVPDVGYVADVVTALEGDGNSATARATLADDLMDADSFAANFVAELENRVLAGDTLDGRYDFLCAIYRDGDPACMACPPPSGDFCTGCDCPSLTALSYERDQLTVIADDMAGGMTTGEVERAFGGSYALRFSFGDPAQLTTTIFQLFLGRPAEADEMANGAAMIGGALLPDQPAGLLFLRHGADFDELIDIVFDSEPYRDAAVDGVFMRYLGRPATPVERAHFSAQLDEERPDVRDVVRAVVSSREYFEQ
jgi:hypothetical protein